MLALLALPPGVLEEAPNGPSLTFLGGLALCVFICVWGADKSISCKSHALSTSPSVCAPPPTK